MSWKVIRQDFRRIRRTWKESLMIALTLGIGVAASTLLFALLYRMVIRPLPYSHSEQLVYISETNSGGASIPAASPDVADWQAMSHGLESLASYGGQPITVLGGSYPVRVEGTGVSRDFFHVLQVQPAMGRTYSAEEQQLHGSPVVLVSDRFWKDQLGGRPEAIGKSLRILDMDFTVIGVMPPAFEFPGKTQIWISREIFPSSTDRSAHNDFVIGRLKPGASVTEAGSELQGIARELQAKYPTTNHGVGVRVETLQEHLLGEQKTALLLAFGVGLCVLIIAGANLANLFLSRVLTRQNELLIREAFGATRNMIVKDLLREAVLLAVAGGSVGLLGTYVSIRILRQWSLSWSSVGALGIDGAVSAYAFVIAVLAACLAVIAAAFNHRRSNPAAVVRGAPMTSTTNRQQSWLRTTLVSAEVGIAFAVCLSAGLLLHSWDKVASQPSGLRDANMLVANLSLPAVPGSEEAAAQHTVTFYQSLLQQVSGIAGVRSAAVVNDVPFSGNDHNGNFIIEGSGESGGGQENGANFRVVSSEYFNTMGIPVLEGRGLSDSDNSGATAVAVIDAETRKQYFRDHDPIGRRIKLTGLDPKADWATVVGVCGTVRDMQLNAATSPHIYVPLSQHPGAVMDAGIILRTEATPTSLIGPVRNLVAGLQPGGVVEFTTTSDLLANSLKNFRLRASLVLALSLIALALSMIGIYALASTMVRERRKEIAIRIAVGADLKQIVRFVLFKGLLPVLYGAAAGLALSYSVAFLWRKFLFGVSVWDPATFIAVPALLIGAGLLANVVPAFFSVKINTQQMLKEQ
ncbi:MAG: ADOP family duplicated permease [Acidobacteriia bacterium]|nr:ADOP family duplicated permease [Terriglobia bacterium]